MKFIIIGFVGGFTVYINISVEEAKKRYLEDHQEYEESELYIREMNVVDEFQCYDIWEK